MVGLGAANAMAAAGDSLIAGAVNGGSPYYQAVRRASLPYRDAGNFAVAGTRTDQIASQIPSAAAAGGSVLCMNGGVNDIAQSIAEGTLRANLIANWSAARALQMEPVSIGMPPTNTAGNVPRYVASEVWRKLYCRKNNIRHVDIWSVLATSAGAYQSGLFSDAIHYNSVGAIAAAARLASVLDSPTGRFPALLAMTDTGSDAGGFIQNAISFTDTNADGVPDSWFASGAGGTYTVQPADAGDFGKWARCSLTAGTNVGMTATAVTLASLGWSVGDRIAVAFRIRWTDASQALSVSCNTTGITTSSTQNLFQETGGATGNSLTVYNEQVISGGTTINLAFFASGTGFFEINRPVIVNLTLLGFPNGVA